MSIAEQYPARTDANGRTWWRPVRPAGTDLSQWGWTSDPAQAHPDYDALNTCTCPYVDPSLWTTHYGAVEPGSAQEHNPLCPVHPAAAVFELPSGGVAIVPRDPQPVTSVGVLGDEWVQLGYVDETQGALW
ncbi:hypothetical protein I5H09_gp020 [Mycobacterium phage Yunkel11]|uniref:Uncharacterized protein n=1 Tax=Mycobacterium phage Yunkel11 TaxID=2599886 RepID=A0A5J6TC30_9CAUD|nr:hypothetical protein I5H09_gp020 [Mycobacterium phage Yunkel11]QFG08471.1 hypothetical protein SEA_YUNKEL11_86 [Mycobacterium phage Yunkel11]